MRVVYWSLIACNICNPAGNVVEEGSSERPSTIRDLADREYGNVARAVCYRGDQPEPAITFPSIWNMYYPTKWDWMNVHSGRSVCFFTLFLLFVALPLPMISIVEMRSLVRETDEKPE